MNGPYRAIVGRYAQQHRYDRWWQGHAAKCNLTPFQRSENDGICRDLNLIAMERERLADAAACKYQHRAEGMDVVGLLAG